MRPKEGSSDLILASYSMQRLVKAIVFLIFSFKHFVYFVRPTSLLDAVKRGHRNLDDKQIRRP